jgi:hypothetical protein
MKKMMPLFVVASLLATQAFATYVVLLKDGTQYKAKAKWTIVNGKAIVNLETGQSLAIDPSLIDVARSEQATKNGLGDAHQMDLTPNMPDNGAPKQAVPSLGSRIKLRTPQAAQPVPVSPSATAPASGTYTPAPIPAGGSALSQEVVAKFERAYENVGIFEHKLTPNGAHGLRVELTADSEDKVFNAISATSFLTVRNAGVAGAQVDMVQLFMKTTNGGSAGRFEMSRADAEALDQKKITQQEYFVRNVIY